MNELSLFFGLIWLLITSPLILATFVISAALIYLIVRRIFKVKNMVLSISIALVYSLNITLFLSLHPDFFYRILDLLVIYLLFFSPLIIVPALIYLIVRRIFKIRNRPQSIFFTLVVSLAFAVAIPYLIESLSPQVQFNSTILLWSDCSSAAINVCPCPVTALCGCRHTSFIVCTYVQYYEWALIIISGLLITACLINDKVKKEKKK